VFTQTGKERVSRKYALSYVTGRKTQRDQAAYNLLMFQGAQVGNFNIHAAYLRKYLVAL